MNTFNFYERADGTPVRLDNDPESAAWLRAEAMVEFGRWKVMAREVPEPLADLFWETLQNAQHWQESFAV